MAQQTADTHAQKSYTRFSVPQRIEHIVLLVSFTTLAITGLIQKFSGGWLADGTIAVLGGIEATRIIHRIAAIVFVLQSIYHILVVGHKVFVRRGELSMLPGLRDVTDAIDVLRYNLGLAKHHPKLPRYNFAEKAEYWALIWGGVVMAITGFMLWNPIATARFLPGQIIPAAKAAHGGEAILAVLAIIVWHFYSVHIKFFNKSMFTGKLTRHQMAHEHGEELERIETGRVRPAPDPEGVRRRERIYVPIALVIGLVFAVGLYWFSTFEETALATVPPPATEVPVFVPLTPTPAPESTGETTQIGSPITHPIEGREECDTCHGLSGMMPYPADHEGRPNDSCTICHLPGPTPEPGAEQPAGGDGTARPIPHPIEGEAYADCATCHGPGMIKPFPENHNNFPQTACTSCHQPVGEAPAAGETPAAAETPTAAGPNPIPHPIEGEVYAVCTNCHGEGKPQAFPENHKTFPPETCTSCHQPAAAAEAGAEATPEAAGEATPRPTQAPNDYPTVPHPVEGETYENCLACHNLDSAIKPIPANHENFPLPSCTTCHLPAQ